MLLNESTRFCVHIQYNTQTQFKKNNNNCTYFAQITNVLCIETQCTLDYSKGIYKKNSYGSRSGDLGGNVTVHEHFPLANGIQFLHYGKAQHRAGSTCLSKNLAPKKSIQHYLNFWESLKQATKGFFMVVNASCSHQQLTFSQLKSLL